MRVGLRAQPSIVVPNVGEAEEAVGYEFTEPEDLNTALADLVRMGAEEAIITTANGCVALVGEGHAKHVFEATIEPLAAVASVGSGDAFLAGFVAARRAGRPIEDCLGYGVACGAESTQHLGAGHARSGRGREARRPGHGQPAQRAASRRLSSAGAAVGASAGDFSRSFRARGVPSPSTRAPTISFLQSTEGAPPVGS